jgi:hypothetical protein
MSITKKGTNERHAGLILGAAVLGAAAMCCSAPARAANASDLSITMTATPPDTVSVSRQNLMAYIAYRVTLANTGGNTINQVTLTGVAAPNGTTPAAFNSVVSNSGIVPSCGPTGAATIGCTIGQMKAGAGSDFFLLFQTPTDGSAMTFTLSTTFSEGNSPNTPPANIVGATLVDNVGLVTTTSPEVNTHVKTVLPPAGGTFFTGPNGVVSSSNPFASSVTLPNVQNLVTDNSIDQSTVPSFACNGAYFCYGLLSTINVDDAKSGNKVYYDQVAPGQIITIVLRQDASSLATKKPVPKVGDVQIFYNPTPDPMNPGAVGALVPPCAAGLPAENQPCVSGRVDNFKGNKGYYEYQIRAVDNGKFSW